ncbi:MAG: hypothetical protein K8F91_23075 [Candidatus Obscuribacterales bacterium]|nr:hypothetical protein [Candidatus Obscuribacterales bacterium]
MANSEKNNQPDESKEVQADETIEKDSQAKSDDSTEPTESETAPATSAEPAIDKDNEEKTTEPAAETKSGKTTPATAEELINNRSNFLVGFSKTVAYIGKVSADKTLTFRESDKLTFTLLVWALVLSVAFAILPFAGLNMPSLSAFCCLMADILLISAILGFTLTRFGIIRAMEPRYAAVTWHLMVGTGLLALTLGFNLVAIIAMVALRDKFPYLFGGL